MSQVPEHLRTGLPLVDHEHQALLDLLQRTRAVCPDRGARDCHGCPAERSRHCFVAFERVLNESINFMLGHFAHEERLMDQGVAKAHVAGHQAAHAEIANAVLRMTTYLDSTNTAATSRQLAQVFEDWLFRHIEEWDLDLARQVRERTGTGRQ